MSRALLIVPPLLKYRAGPLAGPAQLAGAARANGHQVDVIDLNVRWLRRLSLPWDAVGPIGDHARPAGGLSVAARAWSTVLRCAFADRAVDPLALHVSFDQVDRAAMRLARSPIGRRWGQRLRGPRPHLVGISVLWSGQVGGALALAILAKQRWPGVMVVLGGAHVTALAPEIAADPRYGRFVDGFVSGYAEGTFVDMLDGHPMEAAGVFPAGLGSAPRARELGAVVPSFGDLDLYGHPTLVLPAQSARGCAYARCAFCTYPAVEGAYRRLGLEAVDAVVRQAVPLRAHVAVKDALVPRTRLDDLGKVIDGRTPWAACTRLVPRLGAGRVRALAKQGLRTLEVGVEALDPETLGLIDKQQPPGLVEDLLADAAGTPVHLVLNLMVGFPGQRREDAETMLEKAFRDWPDRFSRTRFSIELNALQVERRAPLALEPERFGIELGRSWPWSSTLDWNAPSWAPELVAQRRWR